MHDLLGLQKVKKEIYIFVFILEEQTKKRYPVLQQKKLPFLLYQIITNKHNII